MRSHLAWAGATVLSLFTAAADAQISVAFSGAGKQTLYIAATGAVGPRNVAMMMYRVGTLAKGFTGRSK